MRFWAAARLQRGRGGKGGGGAWNRAPWSSVRQAAARPGMPYSLARPLACAAPPRFLAGSSVRCRCCTDTSPHMPTNTHTRLPNSCLLPHLLLLARLVAAHLLLRGFCQEPLALNFEQLSLWKGAGGRGEGGRTASAVRMLTSVASRCAAATRALPCRHVAGLGRAHTRWCSMCLSGAGTGAGARTAVSLSLSGPTVAHWTSVTASRAGRGTVEALTPTWWRSACSSSRLASASRWRSSACPTSTGLCQQVVVRGHKGAAVCWRLAARVDKHRAGQHLRSSLERRSGAHSAAQRASGGAEHTVNYKQFLALIPISEAFMPATSAAEGGTTSNPGRASTWRRRGGGVGRQGWEEGEGRGRRGGSRVRGCARWQTAGVARGRAPSAQVGRERRCLAQQRVRVCGASLAAAPHVRPRPRARALV